MIDNFNDTIYNKHLQTIYIKLEPYLPQRTKIQAPMPMLLATCQTLILKKFFTVIMYGNIGYCNSYSKWYVIIVALFASASID